MREPKDGKRVTTDLRMRIVCLGWGVLASLLDCFITVASLFFQNKLDDIVFLEEVISFI
jgi:hypothetical protein